MHNFEPKMHNFEPKMHNFEPKMHRRTPRRETSFVVLAQTMVTYIHTVIPFILTGVAMYTPLLFLQLFAVYVLFVVVSPVPRRAPTNFDPIKLTRGW